MQKDEKTSRIKTVVEEQPSPSSMLPVPDPIAESQPESQPQVPQVEPAPSVDQNISVAPPPPTNEFLPENDSGKGSNLKLIFITAFVTALVVGLVAGGVYVYLNGTSKLIQNTPKTATSTPSSSSLPTQQPAATDSSDTKTPQTDIDVSKFKINILNGSGKIGEAGNAKKLLEDVGFKVGSTGNASNFNFKKTLVQAKEAISEDIVDLAVGALSDNYKVELGDNLKTSETYDFIITVGSE